MENSISSKTFIESGLCKPDLEKLLQVSKKAALIGGNILMENYGKLKSINSKGRIGDLVTNVDLASEKAIIEYLQHQTKDISILAEESGLNSFETDLCWCIDPLDGTTNYAHGFPFFATSIGLTWKDKPLLGAISVPFFGELFWGAPRIGAFCNDDKISVSNTTSLINSLLVTGFAYDRQNVLDNNYAEFCRLTHITRGVRRAGAAAVDLAFVATGRLDGYWERGLAKWDLAAGIPIVEAAGGVVNDYKEDDFNFSNGRVLATNSFIQKELKEVLSKIKPLPKDSYNDN